MNPFKKEEKKVNESDQAVKPINQWVRLNKIMAAYRFATLALGITVLGFLFLTAYLVNRDTLVVTVSNDGKHFFRGQRKEPTITDSDVETISRIFITTRYTWGTGRGEHILKELAPFTSEGLLQKLSASVSKNRAVMQQTAQDVIIRGIRPEDGRVYVSLDRVIQVSDKMKVVSPLELTLTLIRGSINRLNPMGLYINSVLEHEGD